MLFRVKFFFLLFHLLPFNDIKANITIRIIPSPIRRTPKPIPHGLMYRLAIIKHNEPNMPSMALLKLKAIANKLNAMMMNKASIKLVASVFGHSLIDNPVSINTGWFFLSPHIITSILSCVIIFFPHPMPCKYSALGLP